ncbi:hypothetical protein BHQ17_00625 [Mycolicibacterium holsaticum]|uniref:Uncharacterized protein n=1 Tax=Mycolicibacterium holsaticum TaxID=152142 RepID=A0A1E3S2Z7_9MYCO|nr:hypothetical protein BHQ17_00625 [Mycolicibacterium holsaticum]
MLSVGPAEAIRVTGGEKVSQLSDGLIYEGFQDGGFDVGVPLLTACTGELTELPKQLQESVTRMRRHAWCQSRSRTWFVEGFAIFQHPQIRHGTPPQLTDMRPRKTRQLGDRRRQSR